MSSYVALVKNHAGRAQVSVKTTRSARTSQNVNQKAAKNIFNTKDLTGVMMMPAVSLMVCTFFILQHLMNENNITT